MVNDFDYDKVDFVVGCFLHYKIDSDKENSTSWRWPETEAILLWFLHYQNTQIKNMDKVLVCTLVYLNMNYSQTSTNSNFSTMPTFYGPSGQSIHSLLF